MQHLEVLNLGNNHINDSFPCRLRTLQSLKVLVLRSNSFHGPLSCPEKNYSSWRLLQIVDLASNNFNGALPSELFSSCKAMSNSVNDPDSSAADHLGFDILRFSQLRYLDRVTVASKGLQLELVKILTIYTSVDLSSNNFHGEIPEEVGNLTALYVLDLSHNALAGQIPSALVT
ncbi:hypothetical protein LIER_35058 [Lithospermum erythrorhizon]|uniref:Uncharacterized protein n=1 Tax=Lithospermum erythrorhizon TaxID=34254 RepID=A0AAV3NJD5_LITER